MLVPHMAGGGGGGHMWYQLFRTVLETPPKRVHHEVEEDISGDVVGDAEGDIGLINELITKDEVPRALMSQKMVKHQDQMVLLEKCLKTPDVLDFLFSIFVKLFNEIFDEGIILKTGQTQSFTLCTKKKKETQVIQMITGVFLSQMSVGNCVYYY